MKAAFAVAAGLLLSSAAGIAALAGGIDAERLAQNTVTPPAPDSSPYLPGSPVWASPYVAGPVLGGVFYDGPSDEAIGARLFSPTPGVSCSLRRHACWTPTGIDRAWTARFFGVRS